ncbi:polysaccharide biosynthesis protein [Pseudoalteromonas sp. Scap03]|jgi:protein involved in polysaccharide export with SLBB domain|nr:SLBB domain-containing protein [Pseudoalteromonas sp. Scap03]NWL15259.1 polysaccharide biosynthesis protein [Pseudoalteromonas sp. Scap03]QLE82895.1 polysaccharide biosynthesis protein [Pseudoalteromonas sp. Scap25]QLE90837.1 polysaccharide biosynthesis protein [Pseudoalteromonas sp. Scap06]
MLTSTSAIGAEERVQPTEQQLEQFKKLPESQQEALAKKYGIDLSALKKSKDKDSDDELLTPSVLPRNSKTKIDDEEFQTEEEKFKPKSDEPKPFGYELFSGEPTTFTPSENALVPDSYIVGPGDTFTINLYGKESSSEEVEVDREGRLAIDKLQPVSVSGMQYSEVVKLIKVKVEKEMIGVEPFVSMGKTRSIRVMVLGEAYLAGAYTIPALSSISHALFVSGGISEIGSLRNIQLKRAGKTIQTLDLYDLLIRGDSSDDVILKPGDVVFIPTVGKQVTVDGEVRRPAIFELQDNESVHDLIEMAGGFNGAAYPQRTVVERYTGNSFKTILQIDLTNSDSKYIAKNGDKIKVPSSSEELNDAVTLLGAVTYPGNYSWSEGDKVSKLFTSIKSDLLPIADYEYALIIREVNIKGDIEVHQFSPLKAIANNPEQDIELKARDKVVVFSRFQSKEDEEIALDSLALTQEQIKLREKMALWDDFEQKQFYEFIDLGDSLDKELAEQVEKQLAEEDKNRVTAITEILNKKVELEDDEYSYFSRERLLKPILAKLNQQAGYKSKVQIYAIRGEVYHEGIYPRPVNANINKAIASAGGLKESAFLESAEITRFSPKNAAMLEHVNINLDEAVSNPTKEKFLVHSKDSINVYPIPNWQKGLKVSLYGEVKFPGDYDIRKGESLREVIKRAGGFTDYSYPEGAVFTRENLRFQQQQQLNKLSEDLRRDITSKSFNSSITDSSLSYEDMNSLINDLAKVKAVGRLVINLPAIVEGKLDIPLEDSDTLYIPSKQNSINVVGEVNFSSSHLFDSALSVDDYIGRSGGFKQRADEDRVYIIKASGLVKIPNNNSWFGVDRSEILEPGDTVVVPLDTEHVDNLTLWSTATQILYQMGVALAAVSSL